MTAEPVSDSSVAHSVSLYDEVLNEETSLDMSSRDLEMVSKFNNNSLCALYLQNNKLMALPDDFFPSLPNLMWLDVRDNQLYTLPSTIKEHGSLTHLLLQNNKITSLPNALGTVPHLKVLQLKGNPLVYPPNEVIHNGVEGILGFLLGKYFDELFEKEKAIDNNADQDNQSYNSVRNNIKKSGSKTAMSVRVKEKEFEDSDDDRSSRKQKVCPRLAKCIFKNVPTHYLNAQKKLGNRRWQLEMIKEKYLKEKAMKKHRELLVKQEKVLQDRRNLELLSNWRQNYRKMKFFANPDAKLESFPYDTDPEYLTLLSREDIEKDLPDKYRKKLIRRSKPTVPRTNKGDVHLALKIKQLFDNLEAIDVNRRDMTPRTEQKVLLGEIQKISEIKQKLMELSVSNTKSVATD